jgi:uncharacterized protein (TIGR00296 family)
MAGKLSLEQGSKLVKLARKSMEYSIASGAFYSKMCEDKELLEQRGVFVTLHSFPGKELRGCIGMPYPVKPLWSAVIEMAAASALKDPRFRPITSEELGKAIVEVSVLTLPEEILGDRKKLPKFIKLGEDGLIVKRGQHTGLLLPQVATEFGWKAEEFLEHCCEKAGLMKNLWQSKETTVFKFQAQIFSETEPCMDIEEIK